MSNLNRGHALTLFLIALVLLAGVVPTQPAVTGPRDRWLRLWVGGRERLALVHTPPGYDGTRPLSLVLALHGEGGNAETAQRMTGLNAGADRDGFIVAYPNGSGAARRRRLTWNAGGCCGYAQSAGADDLAFLRMLVGRIQGTFNVDPRRIYAVGFGNGGMMTYRLGCELSNKMAAIAVVGGALMVRCEPAQPVSVLVIHGTKDPFVPYEGGKPASMIDARARTYPSVANTVAFWVKHNGCQPTPRRTERGSVVAETYPGGRNGVEVTLITVQGGGHTWPAGAPPQFSATGAVLDFFSAHPKRQ